MACGGCSARRDRAAGGGTVVGYKITYRDGKTEEVMSTDLAKIRRMVTLGGGGTHKPILSK